MLRVDETRSVSFVTSVRYWLPNVACGPVQDCASTTFERYADCHSTFNPLLNSYTIEAHGVTQRLGFELFQWKVEGTDNA